MSSRVFCHACGAGGEIAQACYPWCPVAAARELPERVPLRPFWRPFAGLLVLGNKTIETRPGAGWRLGWVAVYATAKCVSDLRSLTPDLPEEKAIVAALHNEPHRAGCIVGVICTEAPRLLLHADRDAAFFYAEGRVAMPVCRHVRFARPLTLEEVGVRTAPQSAVYIPRAPLVAALQPQEVPDAACSPR